MPPLREYEVRATNRRTGEKVYVTVGARSRQEAQAAAERRHNYELSGLRVIPLGLSRRARGGRTGGDGDRRGWLILLGVAASAGVGVLMARAASGGAKEECPQGQQRGPDGTCVPGLPVPTRYPGGFAPPLRACSGADCERGTAALAPFASDNPWMPPYFLTALSGGTSADGCCYACDPALSVPWTAPGTPPVALPPVLVPVNPDVSDGSRLQWVVACADFRSHAWSFA